MNVQQGSFFSKWFVETILSAFQACNELRPVVWAYYRCVIPSAPQIE